MLQSVMFIFILSITDLGRRTHTLMLTTVPDKLKTIILCGTWLGEFSCTSTIQFFIHFSSLVTPNLALTVVSGSSKKPTKLPTFRLYMKSRGWLKLQAMLALTKLNWWELMTGEYSFLFMTGRPSWNPISRKKYQHFRFSKDSPGMVFCKEFVTSPERPYVVKESGGPSPSTPSAYNQTSWPHSRPKELSLQ